MKSLRAQCPLSRAHFPAIAAAVPYVPPSAHSPSQLAPYMPTSLQAPALTCTARRPLLLRIEGHSSWLILGSLGCFFPTAQKHVPLHGPPSPRALSPCQFPYPSLAVLELSLWGVQSPGKFATRRLEMSDSAEFVDKKSIVL